MQAVLSMGSIILSQPPLFEVFGRLLLEPLFTTALHYRFPKSVCRPDPDPVLSNLYVNDFSHKIYLNISQDVPSVHINLDILVYLLDIILM